MEDVSNLITHKLNTLVNAEDWHSLQCKRKAITSLLPYAVWQERDGRPEMLNMFLLAARASRERQLTWNRIDKTALMLLSEATPRAVVLASPHIPWGCFKFASRRDLVEKWATAASALPYTEEVGQSVADVLLQIASIYMLEPSIPVDIRSWLTKQPPLPPICMGRYVGTRSCVVRAIRELKDIEILKSYFLLVWSEWDDLRDSYGFNKMCGSIRKDFRGIGMGDHRAELIQRLDHVLEQLDRGLENLKRHNPKLGRYDLWQAKRRYRKLKELLLEAERRKSSPMIALFRTLTQE